MCIVCKGRRTASLYVQSTQKPSKPQISQTFPVAEVNESGHQGSDPSKTQIPKEIRLRHHEDRKTRPVCGQPSEIYNVTDHLLILLDSKIFSSSLSIDPNSRVSS